MPRTYQVVCIEDDLDIFTLIQLILQKLPIEWHHAATGKSAVALLSRPDVRPDLIILDIALPGLTGWQVLDQVRAQEDNKLEGVPIIVTSVHTEAPHRMIAAVQQVRRYLPKPFSPADLRKEVVKLLKI